MAVHGLNDLEVSGCALSVDLSKPLCLQGYCMCETWTIRKAERAKINAFKFWCWRRTLHNPRTNMVTNELGHVPVKSSRRVEGMMEAMK